MSTYLSHPVRRIRDEPANGELVKLVAERGDLTADVLTRAVQEHAGTVEADLQFDCHLIDVPETAVSELCELGGLARIETAETLSVAPRETELSGELTDPDAE